MIFLEIYFQTTWDIDYRHSEKNEYVITNRLILIWLGILKQELTKIRKKTWNSELGAEDTFYTLPKFGLHLLRLSGIINLEIKVSCILHAVGLWLLIGSQIQMYANIYVLQSNISALVRHKCPRVSWQHPVHIFLIYFLVSLLCYQTICMHTSLYISLCVCISLYIWLWL